MWVWKKLSYTYLLAIPVLTTALAFIVGHTAPAIYIPVWLLNGVLMYAATRTLAEGATYALRRACMLLTIPWMLIAIFGGMGPPPETAAAWAALAPEQVAR